MADMWSCANKHGAPSSVDVYPTLEQMMHAPSEGDMDGSWTHLGQDHCTGVYSWRLGCNVEEEKVLDGRQNV